MRHICVARPSRFGFPQAAAAETLLGVASHAATSLAERMPTILGLLWDALLVLDDLTASTGAVLKLLAEFTQVGESQLSLSLPPLTLQLGPLYAGRESLSLSLSPSTLQHGPLYPTSHHFPSPPP